MADPTYNLSELFEQVADVAGPRTALVTYGRRLTYDELDARANRLAHHLAGAGIGPGDHVGLHLLNGTEYVEGMLAAYKLRAVPININYRYVARELEHLYSSMDLVGLIVHRRFAPAAVAAAPASLRTALVVEDASDEIAPSPWTSYEDALAGASPERDFEGRTSDDLYCACTGGTTGLPKGVMWRHEDIFFASLGGGDPTYLQGPIREPGELAGRIPEQGVVMLITPPLMHVSAHWSMLQALFGGGKVVFPRPGSFDPAEVCQLAAAEQANVLVLVGNAMAVPLVEYLAEHPVEVPSLFAIGSGGAVLSPAVKERLTAALPHVIVMDGFGSTETGVAGTAGAGSGTETASAFRVDETTAVLDDDLRPLPPGSDRPGRIARRGHIPLGYYNDPEKTAATFVEVDGVRWVLPGDLATVEDDGSIRLLGRGSASINTGGEKVFPEEVESALISHDAVADVLVVGVPDDRWGEQIVAVVQPVPDRSISLDELQAHARDHLAGYKVPRRLVTVEHITRSPSGKPDYGWARERAAAEVASA